MNGFEERFIEVLSEEKAKAMKQCTKCEKNINTSKLHLEDNNKCSAGGGHRFNLLGTFFPRKARS